MPLASGKFLLDAQGRRILRADGKAQVANGEEGGDTCGCGCGGGGGHGSSPCLRVGYCCFCKHSTVTVTITFECLGKQDEDGAGPGNILEIGQTYSWTIVMHNDWIFGENNNEWAWARWHGHDGYGGDDLYQYAFFGYSTVEDGWGSNLTLIQDGSPLIVYLDYRLSTTTTNRDCCGAVGSWPYNGGYQPGTISNPLAGRNFYGNLTWELAVSNNHCCHTAFPEPWSPLAYETGDVAFHDGTCWQAQNSIPAGGDPPSGPDWVEVSCPYPPWGSGVVYHVGDVVHSSVGAVYRCIAEHTSGAVTLSDASYWVDITCQLNDADQCPGDGQCLDQLP